jgi:Tol biopolymer transport system component
MDVAGHKVLWVSPLDGGSPEKVFEFDDPDARIDYPVWSPDGQWILFDRFRPQGGDILDDGEFRVAGGKPKKISGLARRKPSDK